MSKILIFLKLIRWPNLLMIVFTQFLAKVFLVAHSSKNWLSEIADFELFCISLATMLIAASGYIINDYFDVKIDLINKPKKVYVGRHIRRRWAMTIHQILNISGCLLGLYVSKKMFLVNIVAVALLWFYSSYLKRKPLVGNIAVALLSALMLIVLAIHYQQNQWLLWLYAAFAFGISLVRELVKDIEDIPGDGSHGCRTLPIVWGIRPTKVFITFLLLILGFLLIYSSILLHNYSLHNVFACMVVGFIYFAFRMVKADQQKDYAFLSNFSKILMLIGILTMIWV